VTTATGLGSYAAIASPIGELLLLGDDRALRGLYMQEGRKPGTVPRGWDCDPGAFVEVRTQLGEYFAGTRRSFDLPLEPAGSDFQLQVWRALLEIGYGETVTYGELARRIGRPNAPRAVGAANGANPLSLVIPCHRLVGSDGALTGYGGGIERKRLLLELEARSR
jgi:methylated-DNA-[protein]-cysteine S-methyltransferase